MAAAVLANNTCGRSQVYGGSSSWLITSTRTTIPTSLYESPAPLAYGFCKYTQVLNSSTLPLRLHESPLAYGISLGSIGLALQSSVRHYKALCFVQ